MINIYDNKWHKHTMMGDLKDFQQNARNDICHHRRIGESIKSNTKYTKKKMTKSDVQNALEGLNILLGYDNLFDVKEIKLKYNSLLHKIKRFSAITFVKYCTSIEKV